MQTERTGGRVHARRPLKIGFEIVGALTKHKPTHAF